ncbi:hypothetical protein P154DRAFT_517011 [Amniculicola lignicola CBS 123094]|uniref:Uncharacterized protein n=1 Tax=Amniculicola lignicola CBS 123094 TaxID=1392246 RepID=A0A6A5X058_9PLEO|nr:hypothetical protein P154DRAFT_517011 [Amniculicola lignicola CBS 123094]
MAANAPYYQLRGGQFTSGANAHAHHVQHQQHFAPEAAGDYELGGPPAVQHAHVSSMYDDPQQHVQTQSLEGGIHGMGMSMSLGEDGHDNLVELLEAAATAAEQAVGGMGRAKRKRRDCDEVEGDVPSMHKRARTHIPTDPQLHGTDSTSRGVSEDSPGRPSSRDAGLGDGRAAGVHSAAALFRRSSHQTARKYTRPPMSKLFMSLQLTPENFLQLQSRAKSYMLDTTHPERQSCVGNRGKGDTDMVKLRLFNCVRDFLDAGVGAQFFGEDVEKPAETETLEAARALGQEQTPPTDDKLVWPRDGNKIISLVTPLLRRMVTNERQRMYAIETRKGGSKRKEGSADAPGTIHETIETSINDNGRSASHEVQHIHSTIDTRISPAFPQNQASHPASPVSAPAHTAQFSYAPYPGTALDSFHPSPESMDGQRSKELPLPIQRQYNLHAIHIYLSKNGIKLSPSKHFMGVMSDYAWAELLSEIRPLVQLAMVTYPALRTCRASSTAGGVRESKSASASVSAGASMAPEALRGLAVAATEIQANNNTPVAAEEEETTTNDASSSPAKPPSSELPAFQIRVLTSTGLVLVENEEGWNSAKLDVGFSVWAGGVVTLVVEL